MVHLLLKISDSISFINTIIWTAVPENTIQNTYCGGDGELVDASLCSIPFVTQVLASSFAVASLLEEVGTKYEWNIDIAFEENNNNNTKIMKQFDISLLEESIIPSVGFVTGSLAIFALISILFGCSYNNNNKHNVI